MKESRSDLIHIKLLKFKNKIKWDKEEACILIEFTKDYEI